MKLSESDKLEKNVSSMKEIGLDPEIQHDQFAEVDVTELVDISFLMKKAVDEVGPGDAGADSLMPKLVEDIQNSIDQMDSPQQESQKSSSNADLQDEFLGLFDQREDEDEDEEEGWGPKPIHYKERLDVDPGQVFGDAFDPAHDNPVMSQEVLPAIGGGTLGDQRDYHTLYKKPKIPVVGSHTIYVGLDIGAQSIKYVAVRKLGRKHQIVAFGIQANTFDTEGEDGDIVDYAIKTLNLKTRFPRAMVSWHLHGPEVGFKQISLPAMKKQMMDEAVIWSAKKEFDLEDRPSVIEYLKLDKESDDDDPKQTLLMSGCSEELVLHTAEPLLSEDLIPLKTSPLSVMIWRLYNRSSDFLIGKTLAFIDMGAKTTTISFINGGTLEFSREIPTGGKDITTALTGTIFYQGNPYQLTQMEAEELKLIYGFPMEGLEDKSKSGVPVAEYSVLIRPILERLGNEIRRSIDYYKEHFKVTNMDCVYLFGGTSQLVNLLHFLEEFIDDRIEKIQMPANLTHNLPDHDWDVFIDRFAELAVPLSSAIDQDGKLNLLPKYLKGLRYLSLIRKSFIYGVLIMLLGMGFLSGNAYLKSWSSQSEFDVMQIKYKRLEPLKRKFDHLKMTQGGLLKKKNVYKDELVIGNPLPSLLKAVSNLLPRGMSLRRFALERDNPSVGRGKTSSKKKAEAEENEEVERIVLMSGVSHSPKPDAGIIIADFLLNMQDSGFFKELKLISQEYLEEEDELVFELRGILNLP